MKRQLTSTAILIASSASGQVAIDLASTPAEFTIWGGMAGENVGKGLMLADMNGDSILDYVFSRGWTDASGFPVGRVCIVFGPRAFPDSVDLWIETGDTCFEGYRSDPDYYRLGAWLHVADIDRDGLNDVIFGANASSAGRQANGAVGVFRGRRNWPATVRFDAADWRFIGANAEDWLGPAVVADVNGDQAPDLVLFAPRADGLGRLRAEAGEGYIFFGPTSSWAKTSFDLAVDQPAVQIFGADGAADNVANLGDELGWFNGNSVVTGDLNGDGIADLVVGAPRGNGGGGGQYGVGEFYLLNGRNSWPPTLDLRQSGAADFILYGPASQGSLESVAIGDLNADGRADLLACALNYADPVLVRDQAGTCYLLSGASGFSGVRDLAVGPVDAELVGPMAGGTFGTQVRIADVDGDRFEDAVVTANHNSPGGRTQAGEIIVVRGCSSLSGRRDLAVQPGDLSAVAPDEFDRWGSFLTVGDVDADGRGDLLVTSTEADSVGNFRADAGEIHLVRGRALGSSCSAVADAGTDVVMCGGQPVQLSGVGSVISGCPRVSEFRWSANSGVECNWSTSSSCNVVPSLSTEYLLEVRCGDCAISCGSSDRVLATITPDIVPPDQGNVLLSVRQGGGVLLDFSGASATSWRLYRDLDKASVGTTALSPDAGTTSFIDVGAVSGPPFVYYYRVKGLSPCSLTAGP